MKIIKTLSVISFATVILGTTVLTQNPELVRAQTNGVLNPGSEVSINETKPGINDFDPIHMTTSKTQYFREDPQYRPAAYPGMQWQLENAEKTDGGAATVAFNRAFETSQPFSISAKAYIESGDNAAFSTDFMGLVMTTTPPKQIAGEQVIDYSKNSSVAGYAKNTTQWQVAMGVIGYDDQHYRMNFFNKSLHHNVVRESIGGQKNQIVTTDFYTAQKLGLFGKTNGDPIEKTFNITYEPVHRTFTYQMDGSDGFTKTSTLPDKIDDIYLGIIATNTTNIDRDKGGVTITGISGVYDHTTTTVHYIDKNNKPLGRDSLIHSMVGERISISGAADKNWDAPQISDTKLIGSGDSRTIVTQKKDADNQINVQYDAISGQIPYKVVDDDNGEALLKNDFLYKAVGTKYDLTTENSADIKDVIPAKIYFVSAENGVGSVSSNGNQEITIHVKHKIDIIGKTTYTRRVHFSGPDSMRDFLPKDNVQTQSKENKIDEYTGENIDTPEVTFNDVTIPSYPDNPKFKGYEVAYVEDENGKRLDTKTTISWPGVDKDSNQTETVNVIYTGMFKVFAPDEMDFGTITVGDKYYQGNATKYAKSIHGSLYVVHTDVTMANRNWRLTAKLDQDFMVGKPTLELAGGQFTINSEYETEIANQSNESTDGITETTINDANPGMVGLRFTKPAQQAQAGKNYHGTITWTLGTVPE